RMSTLSLHDALPILAKVSSFSQAKTERIPRKNKPMLPQMAGKVFQDGDWLYEFHWNGFRALAELEGTRVTIYSKQGLDYRRKFRSEEHTSELQSREK